MSPRLSPARRRAVALALGLLAAGCRADSSPLNVVPLEGAEAGAASGGSAQPSQVNTFVPEAPSVRVTDRLGNPVPGVEVGFEVISGGGSTNPVSDTTDAFGLATTQWRLGTIAGPNQLRGTAAGIGEIVFDAVGLPGPPALTSAVSGDEQAATVGTALPEPLVVEVRDTHGNPTPGVTIAWTAQDASAAAAPASPTTDSLGRVAVVWTLGTQAGRKTLRAQAGAGGFGTFYATATADAPAGLVLASGDGQTGPAGAALPERLVARVVDQYGNGVAGQTVAWSVTDGAGSVDPAVSVTDSAGRARTRYVTGQTVDATERVAATFSVLAPVEFTALTGPPDNLVVDAMYLTQAAQSYAGSVPLVANRDGLLRVFVLAGAANSHAAEVEVRFRQDGTLFRTDTLRRTSEPVPTAASDAEGSLAGSWNVFVPGSLIQPGLSIEAEVDPSDAVYESDEGDNLRAPVPLDVRVLPELQVTLVPVQVFGSQVTTTGNVSEGNKNGWVAPAVTMFPIASYDVQVREVFTSGIGDLRDVEGWSRVLEEIAALRVSDGSSRYYYGVVGTQASALCGIAYIRGYAGTGMDGNCGPATAAHEWGHNFGRYHAPCGGPAGIDASYPYTNASIGIYGMDVARQLLISPTGHADLMSYCSPEWISDYTYEGVLEYRDAFGAPPAAGVARAPEPSLIVWGRIERGRLVLEPTFESTTVPSLPEATGPFRVAGLDAGGATVFELSFAGAPIDHIDGERHFAFAVPASLARPESLERVRLTGPGLAAAEVVRRDTPAAVAAQPTATRESADRVRLEWDAARHPLAVVRSARTGRVLAFGRGARVVLDARDEALEVTLAGGVGEVRRRVVIR